MYQGKYIGKPIVKLWLYIFFKMIKDGVKALKRKNKTKQIKKEEKEKE